MAVSSHIWLFNLFYTYRYSCILDCLDSLYEAKKEPDVYGVRLSVCNKKVLMTILLMSDTLKPINTLSLYLQEDHVNFTSLSSRVKDTTEELHRLIAEYQSQNYGNREFNKIEGLLEELTERTDLQRRIRGPLHADITPENYLRTIGVPLIYSLIQEVEDAFTHKEATLSAYGFLDPRNLPETAAELAEYGNVAIQRLGDFYGQVKVDKFMGHQVEEPAVFDHTALKMELKSFRQQLFMMSCVQLQTRCYRSFIDLTVDSLPSICF